MTANDVLQTLLYLAVLLALTKPLGVYMAHVYEGERTLLDPVLGPLERFLYRAAGVRADEGMTWKTYTLAMLAFNALSVVVVYVMQRVQGWLPLNPQQFGAVSADSAFNTATSFATNTNWQGYGGEMTMSYLTQMLALTVQNFVSAAAGIATLIAFIRGLRAKHSKTIGNFWVDLVRTTLYILLPMSLVLALLLVSQGVVQNF
ncbi:MAG: potassium-transporting ATPase subunit KdpA, partial [Deltaproteobacteria bacterium]